MNYKNTLKYLYNLDSSKVKLGLNNIKKLLDRMGSPEKELKCIHVAGTNGKGSTCAMIFSILRDAGYKVGLYTSPHLKRFNERIRVNDKFITDKEIVDYYLKIKRFFASGEKFFPYSFFEITTAMAFLYFKDKKIDFAVVEVGLGGRLDATNVIIPLMSVITNIDYEHTNILGKTIQKIAFEKAGIIKENIPVVTGSKGITLNVIKSISQKRKSPLIIPEEIGHNIKFKFLHGDFQYKNASIATATATALKKYHKIKITKEGIINGLRNTKWPGRFEFVDKNVLIDCAHNPAGIKVLANELKILKSKKKYERIIFVFGVLKDKDYIEMLQIILPFCSTIIITSPNNHRALGLSILKNTIKRIVNKNKKNIEGKIKVYAIRNPKNALKFAKKMSKKNDLVVAAGSIYIAGEIM